MNDLTTSQATLREQAASLGLHGLLEHWGEAMAQPDQARWVAQMLAWEAAERSRRSLERRLREAHIGRFKPLADFDWAWPKSIDRNAVEELMTLDFVKDASNVVLVGPNGVGKSMCACNIGYQAVLAGHTALFTTAGQLLGELAALDSDSGLRRKLRQYAVSVRRKHLDAGDNDQVAVVGAVQRCGSKSSTRLAGWVGSRSRMSFRYA